MSHGQRETASQAEMGRPELASAWDSSWSPAWNATLEANTWAVMGHVQTHLSVGLAAMRHSALRDEPPFTLFYIP